MKKIDAGKKLLSANDRQAARNAELLKGLDLTTVNVLASPGAGKTSVIVQLLKSLPGELRSGVIEGDVASSIDTDYIRSLGYPATQINTDGGCHLDATMVAKAIEALAIKGPGFLFIENIGNLICPAGFNLGENLRIVVASVPEGDDKPIKYPGIFATASAVVLNKTDLLPHLKFDMGRFISGLRVVNGDAPLSNISCQSGSGVAQLSQWLAGRRKI